MVAWLRNTTVSANASSPSGALAATFQLCLLPSVPAGVTASSAFLPHATCAIKPGPIRRRKRGLILTTDQSDTAGLECDGVYDSHLGAVIQVLPRSDYNMFYRGVIKVGRTRT
eukprot:691486-Prorocentrum_minimum.AAC.2